MIVRHCLRLTGFAVVFSISLIATVKPELFRFITLIPYGDKIAHFMLFGMLAALGVLQTWRFGKAYAWFSVFLTLVYATADELLQLLFATRSFSLIDLVADISGILVFSTVASYLVIVGSKPKPQSKAVITSMATNEIKPKARIELE